MNIFDKILWVDLETTGINPNKNGVIQMAGIVEIKNEVKEEFDILSNVFPDDVIEDKALEVNKRTREEIKGFQVPRIAFCQFTTILGKYIDKFNKEDKLTFAGYNVGFDKDFLWKYSKKCGERYLGSFVRGYCLDVMQFVIAYSYMDSEFMPADYKLGTIAKYLKIEFNAHDALADIKASRDVFLMLVARLKRG